MNDFNRKLRTKVKRQLWLFVLLCGPLIFLVYITLTFNERSLGYLHGSPQQAAALFTTVREELTPQLEINLTELYEREGRFQLLHPLLDLNKPPTPALPKRPRFTSSLVD